MIRVFITIFNTLCLIQLIVGQSISRSSISALGSSCTVDGAFLSQTAGQGSVHTVVEIESCALRQGFQQPLNSITETSNTPEISVYPNPTSDNLSIFIKTAKTSSCKVSIFDLFGILIWTQEIMSNREQKITLPSNLAPGSYILKVSETNHSNWTITDKIIYQLQ
jgi:hypothetical protein